MDDSERRSLILVNPGLAPRRATVSTMYTAYRLNDANEVMPPHRHSPNAIRFGLTGKGNFTGVGGEDITFGPGDMVLTPVDTWHNHGNVGNEPAVNLSVLDLPLVETLNAVYFEHDYTEMVDGKPVKKKQQTATVPSDYSARAYDRGGLKPRFLEHHRGAGFSSPMYVYRWEQMRELIERFKDWDGDPYEALSIEYVDPLTGGPVFKTMTFFAQMLRPGERTRPVRQTASLLVAPFEGKGHSIIDGKRFDWETVRQPGGAGRLLVRARQRLRQAAGDPVRGERRAGLEMLPPLQEVGPRRRRRHRQDRLTPNARPAQGRPLPFHESCCFERSVASRSNTTLVSHFDCPGGGQVWVEGTTLYIGHMRGAERHHHRGRGRSAPPARARAPSTCRRAGIRTRCGWRTA